MSGSDAWRQVSARLDAERRNRDAFCALLLSERDAGRLHARSRWKDFILRERENPAYVDVSKNLSGSTPRERRSASTE